MRRVPTTLKRLRAALLALTFVCAQALALGHEIGHGLGAEQDVCTVCSIGGGVKPLAAAPEIPIPHPPEATTFVVEHAAQPSNLHVLGPEARAPPSHS